MQYLTEGTSDERDRLSIKTNAQHKIFITAFKSSTEKIHLSTTTYFYEYNESQMYK